MGNALLAQNNVSGAIEFYNYAVILNPAYQEAFQSLLLIKCHGLGDKEKNVNAEQIIAKYVST